MSMIPLHRHNLTRSVQRTLRKKLADRTIPLDAIVEWLAQRGHPVTRSSVRRYGDYTNTRPMRKSRFLRVDQLLSETDRAAYETLIGNPRTTAAEARRWLKERGYLVGMGAVGIHRRRFLDKLDGVRQSARFAQSIVQVAREHGQGAMSDGMLTRFEQVLLEQLVHLEEHEKLDVKELGEMSKCISSAVGSRERIEEVKREHETQLQKATADAEQLAQRGATGKDVVARMREILGV